MEDFRIQLESDSFPINKSLHKINFSLVCICLKGSSKMEVNARRVDFKRNDIIVAFPGQIISIESKTEDFRVAYFTISDKLIHDIIYRMSANFISFLTEYVVYSMPEEESEEILSEYFSTLNKFFLDKGHVYRNEIISNILRNFFMDLYNKVLKKHNLSAKLSKRKSEILQNFFALLPQYCITNRDVNFYAEKLCITPKYLYVITEEGTGSTVKELISRYVTAELKVILSSEKIPLKTIAEKFNFPSEAYLCKFFKKQTGLTPQGYRNKIK